MRYGFGIDIGGTTVKLAYFSEQGDLLHKWEIPTRSEGGGEQILPDIAAAVEGFHLGGVSATLKHFPGHGDTQEDSHNGAAYAYKTLPELMECEMLPFIAGIEAGAELVMVAHITLPALDAERPATLSKPIVTDLLRGELGFSGLVVTDALSMGAITQAYGDEAALLALEAGCDLLLLPEDASAAAALILERADPARIDESVLRILEWKLAQGLIEAE